MIAIGEWQDHWVISIEWWKDSSKIIASIDHQYTILPMQKKCHSLSDALYWMVMELTGYSLQGRAVAEMGLILMEAMGVNSRNTT